MTSYGSWVARVGLVVFAALILLAVIAKDSSILTRIAINVARDTPVQGEIDAASTTQLTPTDQCPSCPVCTTSNTAAKEFKRLYPKGTDPDDTNPEILITSSTDFMPTFYEWFEKGEKSFKRCSNLSPWMKCTYDSDVYNMTVNKNAHAVLFHGRHVKDERKQFKGLPPYRDSTQKWIYYESEAPPNTWNSAKFVDRFWGMFNLTATITSDSDIPLHHIHMKCIKKDNFKPEVKNYASGKTKMAAWFVSHCTTSSKRELYIEELQKYLQVDIYGDCGNHTACSHRKYQLGDKHKCMYDLVTNDYKFYISFENAFCDEYVTEKFHRIPRYTDTIPVVLGAASYANIMSKDSYIDVRDFGSVKDLADFMIKLSQDDDRYNEYIQNAKSHDCFFPVDFQCTLCEYLHKHRYERQTTFDVAEFWSVKNRCVSAKDFYRDYAPELIPRIHYRDPDLYL